jgi:hypothetical protein
MALKNMYLRCMIRILITFVVLSLLAGCGQKKGEAVAQNEETIAFDGASLPKKQQPNAKAGEILAKWPEYNALVSSMDALYTAKGKEDVALVIDDLIDKEKLLAQSEYPEEFKKPQIQSRQAVFQTFVLKVKGALTYNLNLQEPSTELVTAYNAWVNQFSVLMNTYVDLDVILELEAADFDSIPKSIDPKGATEK